MAPGACICCAAGYRGAIHFQASHLLIKLTPVHPPSLRGIKVAASRKLPPLPHNTLFIPPLYLIVVVSRLSDLPGFASHLRLEGASACS